MTEVLASAEGLEHLRAIVHYLRKVAVEAAHEALRGVLDSILSEQQSEELMRTIEEALIDKGRQQGWREGLNKGRLEGLAEGQARGRAEDVLRVLVSRGIAVDDKARALISSCMNLNTLDQWFDRALSATCLADLMLEG